jgi:transglutaminase-like putative cysteine protease
VIEDRFESRWLPLPYAAQLVMVDKGRWLYDRGTWNVYSADATTRERRYNVESIQVAPTAQQLNQSDEPPPDMTDYLTVPDDIGNLRTVAEQQTEKANTRFEMALALQNWLRNDFEYTEQAPSQSSATAMRAFLETKEGFCVHFASTMALLSARSASPRGSPSGGSRQAGPAAAGLVRGLAARPARVAGAVLRGRRVGALRADPALPGEPRARVRAGLAPETGTPFPGPTLAPGAPTSAAGGSPETRS